MLKSGASLAESLDTSAVNTKSASLQKIVKDVAINVREGVTFSVILATYPAVFDQLFINIIKLGESSGTLSENLNYLAERFEKKDSLRKKINSSLLYPKLVISLAFVITLLISIFVLPRLGEMFSSLQIQLPITTRLLLSFSSLMKADGIQIAVILVSTWLVFEALIRTKLFRPLWLRFLMILPIIGSFMANVETSAFCRNLGTLLEVGVPISEAHEKFRVPRHQCGP